MPKNNKLGCSYSTQLKLAKSLKDLMSNQPFEKLSVSDITNNCDLHRQTFYYHFDDKYELLDWIVYKELIEPLVEGFTFDNMYDRFMKLFTTMVDLVGIVFGWAQRGMKDSPEIMTKRLERIINNLKHIAIENRR